MLKKHPYFIIGSSLFLLFVIFSYLVHKNVLTSFDFDTTVRLQDDIPRRLDQLFSLFSVFGGFTVMTIVLVVLLLFRHRLVGLLVVGAYGVIHLFEIYGKFFVNHPPPPHFMLRTEYPINFPQFYVSTENSYPSGHAARTMFVTILLLFLFKDSKRLSREVKIGCYVALGIYDLVMVVSRPYLGEHWTTDVIGGTLLGLSMGFLIKRYV